MNYDLLATKRDAPDIVVTYSHSGFERLEELLAGHPAISCTSGTGLIPLCDLAAATWSSVETGRSRVGEPLSGLAAASVRALAGSLMTIVRSRTGKPAWCEFSTAVAYSARAFLQVFPRAKVIFFHRNCAAVICDAIRSSPWGLGGSGFGSFTFEHPGNPVAAVAAYWHARAEQMLALEQSHPDRCLRVRYEDLIASPDTVHDQTRAFLGLDPVVRDTPDWPDLAADDATCPCEQIPPPLLAAINRIHDTLGYPVLPEPRR